MASPESDPRVWDYEVVSLLKAVDGDTFDLQLRKEVDFGFRLTETKTWAWRFRLLGVNAPEKRTPGGPPATAYSTEWIKNALKTGKLRGQTFKTDDFGRWLIDLYVADEHLTAALINAGHGVPYRVENP